MSGWLLLKSKEALDQFLGDEDSSLNNEGKKLTFPCFGFTFRYADESAGLEVLTREYLTKMLEGIEEAK